MKVFDTLTREMKKFFWSMAHLGCNSRCFGQEGQMAIVEEKSEREQCFYLASRP